MRMARAGTVNPLSAPTRIARDVLRDLLDRSSEKHRRTSNIRLLFIRRVILAAGVPKANARRHKIDHFLSPRPPARSIGVLFWKSANDQNRPGQADPERFWFLI